MNENFQMEIVVIEPQYHHKTSLGFFYFSMTPSVGEVLYGISAKDYVVKQVGHHFENLKQVSSTVYVEAFVAG